MEHKKKKIVFYCTCQAICLHKSICKHLSNQYDAEYYFNFEWISKHKPGEYPESFKEADIFVYQPVVKAGYETEYIVKNLLKENCQVIGIPYMYFLGYFPDYIEDPNNKKTISERYPHGMFPYGHNNLLSFCTMNKMTINDAIIKSQTKNNFLWKKFIEEKMNMSQEHMRKRESMCEIKLADFIQENFRTMRLFNTVNHPSDLLLSEVHRLFMTWIGENSPFEKGSLDQIKSPIYPCVKLHLKLSFPIGESVLHGEELSDCEYFARYLETMVHISK